MEQRTFGRTGLRVSVLGLGGSEIGYLGVPQASVTAMLAAAIEAGLNVIDTAECYADSEEKLGEALASLGGSSVRERVHLFTKVGHEHGWSAGEDYSAQAIERTIDRSLRRLRTDRVELVQLHSCGEETLARGACIEVLERARAQGKTRFIGYSGDGAAALAALRTGRFDVLQTSINVADQRVLDQVLPEAAQRGMGVIAKRPIANAAWQHAGPPPNGYHRVYWERLRALGLGLAERPLSEAAGLALRFTLSRAGVHTAIVGTTRPQRLAENAALLAARPGDGEAFAAFVRRWGEAAGDDWVGQV